MVLFCRIIHGKFYWNEKITTPFVIILSIKKNLKLGNTYKKKVLSEILDEYNLRYVREGLYYCVKTNSTLLFVDLDKINKPDKFKFNDYFEGDFFHWDSQTTQHLESPKILDIFKIQFWQN